MKQSAKKLPMNLPNRVTLARMLMIPIVLCLMAMEGRAATWAAVCVFLLAGVTDIIDGRLARQRGEITNFGKFMDPIADKLLVLLPLLLLTAQGADVSVWAVLIMVAREIIVSGFRLVAAGHGSIIAAGWSGKLKTVVQIIAVAMIMAGVPLAAWAAWIAAALSAYSGFEILWKNRAVLEEDI